MVTWASRLHEVNEHMFLAHSNPSHIHPINLVLWIHLGVFIASLCKTLPCACVGLPEVFPCAIQVVMWLHARYLGTIFDCQPARHHLPVCCIIPMQDAAFKRIPEVNNLSQTQVHMAMKQNTESCLVSVGGSTRLRLPEVNDLVLGLGVKVHMPAELIQVLLGLSRGMGMEAPLCAALHQLQAARRGQPEQATPLAPVIGRHHNGNGLLQHRLVAAVRVYIHTRQEACLCGVGVDPTQGVQLPRELDVKHLLLIQSRDCVCGALLLGDDEGGDGEQRVVCRQLAGQDAAGFNAFCSVAASVRKELLHERNAHMDIPQLRPPHHLSHPTALLAVCCRALPRGPLQAWQLQLLLLECS
mmetsp:Transcript_23141/g.63925  ORF Transcript_23141/g.63925 Transcript_23141/m.63925 type:complete len:356 (-) Transcript_23141:2312-3379(-)